MAATLPRNVRRAVARHGHKVNRLARTRYGISGRTLLSRLIWGESRGKKGAVSPVGARGWGQFMPGTRQAVISHTKGRVDPWRTADEAVRGSVIHLKGELGHNKGLEGYNPGGGRSYVNYILGQNVRTPKGKGGKRGKSGPRGRSLMVGGGLPLGVAESALSGPLSALLAGQQTQQSQAALLPEPEFSARKALKLPAGYEEPPSSPSPPPTVALADQLQLVRSLQGPDLPEAQAGTQVNIPEGGRGGGGGRGGRGAVKGQLHELFYNGPGGVNVDNGKRVGRGFVSGHTNHVHVAAGRKSIIKIGGMAKRMGLSVGEHPEFGGVAPVHTSGSFHYSRRAIDVSGTPAKMRKFSRRVAKLYGHRL